VGAVLISRRSRAGAHRDDDRDVFDTRQVAQVQ